MDVRDTQPVSAVILSQARAHREGKILNGLELSIGGTKLPQRSAAYCAKLAVRSCEALYASGRRDRGNHGDDRA